MKMWLPCSPPPPPNWPWPRCWRYGLGNGKATCCVYPGPPTTAATFAYANPRRARRVPLPVGEPLRILLDRTARRSPMILTTIRGKPWTSDGFRTSWAKACKKAGITGLTFHDLRGSAVVRLALVDATVPQIATFTGHGLRDVEAILDAHYLGRDVKLAEIAVMKLETRTKL